MTLTTEEYAKRQYRTCGTCEGNYRVCFKCGMPGSTTDCEVPLPYGSNTAQVRVIICYDCQFLLIKTVRAFLGLPIPTKHGE